MKNKKNNVETVRVVWACVVYNGQQDWIFIISGQTAAAH